MTTFTAANIKADSLKLTPRPRRGRPTVVTVWWTDTTTTPWSKKSAPAYAPGVLDGTVAYLSSDIDLPGIQHYAQALREAIERLNHFTLEDLDLEFIALAGGDVVEIGDVCTVTHPLGLTDKPVRITDKQAVKAGQWKIVAREYDVNAYSSAVASELTTPDTNLPNPANPPAPADIAVVEELVQMDNGTWSSRIRMTWSASDYPYLSSYSVVIERSAVVIDTHMQIETSYATPPVQEGVEYVCKVAVVSTIGVIGAYAQANITPLGKYLPPQPIPADSMQAFEAGGTVYLEWGQATDIDVWRYRIKRGTTAQTYAQADQIDLVDALRYMDKTAPVGTWRYWVDVVDSVQLESGTPRYKDVVVTSDVNAFLVDAYDQTAPTLTNVKEWSIRADPNRYFVTEDGIGLSTKMTGALSAYTGALANQHASITSTWLGEAEDFGLLLGGNWTGSATLSAIGGSITSSIGFSADASAWAYKSGLSQKENARFVRLKHETAGAATQMVTIPTQNIRLDAVPREETGNATSSASNGVTIYLSNDFVTTKKITLTPNTNTAAIPVYDNIGRNAPNSADKGSSIVVTGNVVTLSSGPAWMAVRTKHPLPTTGKWYWECKVDNCGTFPNTIMIGVCSRSVVLSGAFYSDAASMYYGHNGPRYPGGIAYGATFNTGDVIGIAYDAGAGTITFYKNNTSQGVITGLSGEKFPAIGFYNGMEQVTFRTLTSNMSYAPPTGHLPLPYAFNVHMFDAAGARLAAPFNWVFQGV